VRDTNSSLAVSFASFQFASSPGRFRLCAWDSFVDLSAAGDSLKLRLTGALIGSDCQIVSEDGLGL
jgi:hypothetical protein